jgi:hypothetical protein
MLRDGPAWRTDMSNEDLLRRLQTVRQRAQRARAEARQLRTEAAKTLVKREAKAPAPVEQPVRSAALANTLVARAAE